MPTMSISPWSTTTREKEVCHKICPMGARVCPTQIPNLQPPPLPTKLPMLNCNDGYFQNVLTHLVTPNRRHLFAMSNSLPNCRRGSGTERARPPHVTKTTRKPSPTQKLCANIFPLANCDARHLDVDHSNTQSVVEIT